MIVVEPYNPNWAKEFQKESEKIHSLYGDKILALHHMGSTSVPGLSAKPIIDMIAVVESIKNFDPSGLLSLGYLDRGELIIPFRRVFRRGDPRSHFVHVFEQGDPQIRRNLCFRDFLTNHPDHKKRYGDLKEALAKKYYDQKSLWNYTREKTHVVEECLKLAGFDDYIFNRAYSDAEYEAYQKIMRTAEALTDKQLTNLSREDTFEAIQNHFILLHQGIVCAGAFVEKTDNAYQCYAVEYAPDFTDPKGKSYFSQMIDKWIKENS